MFDYKVKIGLVAMRRNTTDRPRGTFLTWYSAEQRGKKFVDYIEKNFTNDKVSFVDNKGIGIENLVFDDVSAKEVIERFKKEQVDAVMIINCNFGNEEAAADIAEALGKPVLLWAPLDDEYYVDGMRPTDSQCGLFGVSRQMQRYHIPFSHLPCCRVESDEFKAGLESFIRVTCTYPTEDTKMRATASKTAGGGPVATGLVAAQKLGENTAYIGVLSDDNGGKFLKEDFEKYGVRTDFIDVKSGYRSFASVLWLCADTTTRTCVFDKGDLPPLVLNDAQKQAIKDAEILMVDGNEMDAAVEAAEIARESGTKVLYDCGGLYDGVERLLAVTDIMIPSEEFSLGHTGCKTAEDAARKLYETYSPEVVVITQGKRGGIIYDGKEIISYPIYPAVVVDSNGSGDVFHGAFAAAVAKGYDYLKCCHFSSAVSGLKCTGVGARESVPNFETTKKYLQENGYEL